jgi:hypothetical protein
VEEHGDCCKCCQNAFPIACLWEDNDRERENLLIPVAFKRRDIHPQRLSGGLLPRDMGAIAGSAILW